MLIRIENRWRQQEPGILGPRRDTELRDDVAEFRVEALDGSDAMEVLLAKGPARPEGATRRCQGCVGGVNLRKP